VITIFCCLPGISAINQSIDGTLGVYDLRKPEKSKEKLYALSDNMESDLLSI
jgi:hypothetical protein